MLSLCLTWVSSAANCQVPMHILPGFEGCDNLCQIVGVQGPNIRPGGGGKEFLVFKKLAFGLATTDGQVGLLDGLLEPFVCGGSGADLELVLCIELAGLVYIVDQLLPLLYRVLGGGLGLINLGHGQFDPSSGVIIPCV